MALLENPDVPIRFEPEGEAGPCYLLRVPRHFERALLEQEAEALGAEQPGPLELLDSLDLALRRQLGGDPARLDALTAAVAAYRAQLLATAAGDTPPAVPLQVREAEEEMRDRDERYRRRSRAARYAGFYTGCAAARLFVTGLERADTAYEAGPRGGLAERLIDRLPTSHIRGLGDAILRRLMPPESLLGNSASPPGGGSTPTASPSTTTPRPSGEAEDGERRSSAGPTSGSTPGTS